MQLEQFRSTHPPRTKLPQPSSSMPKRTSITSAIGCWACASFAIGQTTTWVNSTGIGLVSLLGGLADNLT